MKKYLNKYRISSTRLATWDYTNPGCYFVTVCTAHRIPYLGEVVRGEIHLSEVGKIVAEEWLRTGQIRPNVELDAWVIMPNHLHGIICIIETPRQGVSITTHQGPIPIQDISSPQRGISIGTNPKWKPNSLGSIINQFKSACTRRIRASIDPDFTWQSRYYDRIIRDDKSLAAIRKYILNNPPNWETDAHHFDPLP